ncbi:MAG: hypothetical protein FD124_127 [Alphaproteobacteria bacterium]|nr:MAG: hypothetical protein FD160_1232 [Caulobacteraceae bacterium]TPW08741.1 MAG: hypothetical protein FD124_127 [Alphaproteobacteria bacterium]
MNDMNNVTPLRRPKPKKPLFDPRDPKSQVQLVYGLSIASFAIMWLGTQFVDWIGMGFGVAALVISVSKRDEGVFWARSHYEFALRTMIIGAVVWTLLSLLGLVIGWIPLVGSLTIFIAKACVLGWVALRSGSGFLKASDTKVIANPMSWLF